MLLGIGAGAKDPRANQLEVVVQESRCDSRAGGVAGDCDSEGGKSWLAAYTKPRHEEKVTKYCEERGIEAFLPCYRTWRRWSDRRKQLSLPLFPSYVFVRPKGQQRGRAVQAPGFLWFVHDRRGPIAVDEGELGAVRSALLSGLDLDPIPSVSVGEVVEIARGSMRGYRGCLISKDGSGVVLRISAIQGAVRVNLPDPSWVRSLP